MTMTTTSPQAGEGGDAAERPSSWREQAEYFARVIAGYTEHGSGRGDLAALRRMDPDDPNVAAFWRLLARRGLLGYREEKWALILHGIALMTRNTGDSIQARSAHDRYVSVGRALFTGGDAQRAGFYSETRFNRLLTARDDMLRHLLVRMFRMMASAGATFDWREMAEFILSEGYNDDDADKARRNIARAYYLAERRAAASAETND